MFFENFVLFKVVYVYVIMIVLFRTSYNCMSFVGLLLGNNWSELIVQVNGDS